MAPADEHGWVRGVGVDLGSVNGRVFVNNVSIVFYSEMVQDPQYRSRRRLELHT